LVRLDALIFDRLSTWSWIIRKATPSVEVKGNILTGEDVKDGDCQTKLE
jgi:hypothetical protein